MESMLDLSNSVNGKEIKLENDLIKALQNKEFLLHYQPQICLSTKEVVGIEALIRWRNAERGLVYPEQFIAFAEKHEIITKIGYEVIRMALNDIGELNKICRNQLKISINIATSQLYDKKIIDFVKNLIVENSINPNKITLEITETTLIKSFDDALKVLTGLKKLGIQIALDDFGKEYSSFNYLCKLPVDLIKIDRSFIENIENNNIKLTIVEGIVQVVHKLNKRVLAEGVENSMQYEILNDMGCDEAQGFYFYKPMRFEKLKKLDGMDLK